MWTVCYSSSFSAAEVQDMLNPIYLELEYIGQHHVAQGAGSRRMKIPFFILIIYLFSFLFPLLTLWFLHFPFKPSQLYTHTHTHTNRLSTPSTINAMYPFAFLCLSYHVSHLSCVASFNKKKKKEKNGNMLLAWLLVLLLTEELR